MSFLRNEPVLSYSRNSPCFMEPESTLQPATCPYPEPHQSSPCPPSHFLKIHFNIIHLCLSSKRSLALRFPNKNHVCTCLPPIHATCPVISCLIDTDLYRILKFRDPSLKNICQCFGRTKDQSKPDAIANVS